MRLSKLVKIIKNIDVYIGPIVLLMILIDVILQVVSRLLPGNAISWTVEVGEMLLGALIWLGISVGVLKNAHVGFDLIVKKFPPKIKKAFGLVDNTLFIVYLILLGSFTVQLLYYYTKLGSKSTILGISMFWVRMPILIGCILTTIRLLIKQYRVLRNQEIVFADDEDVIKGEYE
ncbi:MAG: C4-dicarboxylate transporter, DctQ subunit [Clostridiales bacterium]|nr:C4-dicarboxylate transporter, DctQ subunit [Clostridiales bacterium]